MNWEHVLISFTVFFGITGIVIFCFYPDDDKYVMKFVSGITVLTVFTFAFTALFFFRKTMNG